MARITQLEDSLYNDPNGKVRHDTLDQLTLAKQKLEQQLRKPNNAETHRALTLQHEACVAALHVIETLWQRYHLKLR